MIRLFHKADNDTALVERPPEDLGAARADEGWIWIDVLDPTDDRARPPRS